MRHAGPVGISEQLTAHVPSRFKGRDTQVRILEAVVRFPQLVKRSEGLKAYVHHVPIQDVRQLPRHEVASAKQVTALIASPILKYTGILRRREAAEHRGRSHAKHPPGSPE